MNCVVFATMNQVFSLKNKNKKYWKHGENTGKIRKFCQSGDNHVFTECSLREETGTGFRISFASTSQTDKFSKAVPQRASSLRSIFCRHMESNCNVGISFPSILSP